MSDANQVFFAALLAIALTVPSVWLATWCERPTPGDPYTTRQKTLVVMFVLLILYSFSLLLWMMFT